MKGSEQLLCIAHRGGAGGDQTKENSLAAIQASLDLGVKAFEIDVWQADGELLVFHDRRLSRFSNNDKKIIDCSLVELKALAKTHGFEIPTLPQVIQLIAGRALLNIEIKGPNCIIDVVQCLRTNVENGLSRWQDFWVSSFDQQQLLQCQAHCPELKRGLLICGVPADLALQAERLGCEFMATSLDFVRPEWVMDCHNRGIQAWVYTVNHPEDFDWLNSLGVNAVFTDYPRRLLHWQSQQ